MKKLVLNETESKDLQKDGATYIYRGGFDILVEVNSYYIEGSDDESTKYIITIVNPFDKVVTK